MPHNPSLLSGFIYSFNSLLKHNSIKPIITAFCILRVAFSLALHRVGSIKLVLSYVSTFTTYVLVSMGILPSKKWKICNLNIRSLIDIPKLD